MKYQLVRDIKKDNYRILIEKENFILKPIPALLRDVKKIC